MKKIALSICAALISYTASAQTAAITQDYLNSLTSMPKQYFVVKAADSIVIDGKADDKSWEKAPWSDSFIDIEGKTSKIPQDTKFKMLWDNNYLYVYVQVTEPDIWATYTQQDQSVYHDNAVEMFIDTDGDTQNYVEFQINALATVWDLLMTKPYRNGGASISTWDVKGLKKGVYVNGTLNKPGDKDQYWSAELAFPIRSVSFGGARGIQPGNIWRVNFSRVAWDTEVKDGKYVTKKNEQGRALPEHYNVWTSQGLVNLHFPERFGYIQFVDQLPAQSLVVAENEALKLTLWKYYYLQQDYKTKNRKFAASVEELTKAYPDISFAKDPAVQIYGSANQMWLQSALSSGASYAIDQDGKVYDQRPPAARAR